MQQPRWRIAVLGLLGVLALGALAFAVWRIRSSFDGLLTETGWRPLMTRGYEPPSDFPPPPALLEDGRGEIHHDATIPGYQIVSFNLTDLRDQPMLRPGKLGALRPLGDPTSYRPDAEPVILVHGINGQPSDLQALVQRLREDSRFQLYIYAFDDMGERTSQNGRQLADELKAWFPNHPKVTILAHSMGGIVTLNALCVLSNEGSPLPLRVLTIDTPWHGFSGPPDTGMGKVAMWFAKPWLPDGLEDMRSESRMFVGGPKGDALDQQGIYGIPLSETTELRMVFAADGEAIQYYGEGDLTSLPQQIAALYQDNTPVSGSPELVNYWRALQRSSNFAVFEADAKALATPTTAEIEALLRKHYPVFPGDHTGVLSEQDDGLPEAAARWVYTGQLAEIPPS